ncbi:MAG: Holliday junction resolvase RuvX [Bernardetiaceae bacterium]|nr:Holliday junction resolvase RuvX [Bernardetiaceae bacterium]
MGRIIAIDYGTKRTGLAVTDPLQIIATALTTIHSKDLVDFLKKYQAQEGFEALVIGMPKRLDNTPTSNTPNVVGMARRLRKEFPEVPVHEVDERFTTSIALDTLIAAGTTKKFRREKEGNLDKVSAVLILQSFLEQRQR